MTIDEIKKHIRKGDIADAADIAGVTPQLVKYVLAGERSYTKSAKKGYKAFKAIEFIISSRLKAIKQQETIDAAYDCEQEWS